MKAAFVEWEAIRAARGARASAVPGVAPGLYVCGSLAGLAQPCVAIVGTRAASRTGQSLTCRVAAELARAGVSIISGLALGIDGAAHEGALDGGGRTIGILGGGHARFFPQRNRALAERMLQSGGAVCSPYERDRAAMPHQFLERNGIVAALSDAVVVVEAPSRSGALNTATWAAGRIPVLVFPGDVDRRNVAGCLALIRDGATLVRDANDILQEVRVEMPSDTPLELHFEARDPVQQAILTALETEPLTDDQLIDCIGCNASTVFVALTELELVGAIQRLDGGTFAQR
ncbi:MAG: DNA-processing protein DprA [Candidatus Eremiobacteraeota bacterium]|nr:DNA-processing protein DprA [Candidatus Eremiobacteraeota bacterium]